VKSEKGQPRKLKYSYIINYKSPSNYYEEGKKQILQFSRSTNITRRRKSTKYEKTNVDNQLYFYSKECKQIYP